MKVSDGSGVSPGKSGVVAKIGGKAEGRAAPAPPAADILGEARGSPAADDGGTAVGRPVAAQPLPSPSTYVQHSREPSGFDELLRGTAPTSREARLAGAREESRQGAARPRGSPEARTPLFPSCLRRPSLPSQRWTLEDTGSSGWASLGGHGNSRTPGTHSHSGAGTRPARPRPPPPWRCAGPGLAGAGRGCSSSCRTGCGGGGVAPPRSLPPALSPPRPHPGRPRHLRPPLGRNEELRSSPPAGPSPQSSSARPVDLKDPSPGLSLPGVPAAVPFQRNSSGDQTMVTHLKCQPQAEVGCPKTIATSSSTATGE